MSQQSEKCVNDHENIHIFITSDPATLLPELYPQYQNTRKMCLTQCFIKGRSGSLSYRAHKGKSACVDVNIGVDFDGSNLEYT